MTSTLIVYATSEGQTGKIARWLHDYLVGAGVRSDLFSIEDAPDDVTEYRVCVLGGSVHRGHHHKKLVRWAQRHAKHLRELRTEFFSVSLAAASDRPEEREAAVGMAQAFLAEAGVGDAPITVFAGALRYREYGWLTRWMMRRIAREEGGGTDTSRDYEYTDWSAVERFAQHLLAAIRDQQEQAA